MVMMVMLVIIVLLDSSKLKVRRPLPKFEITKKQNKERVSELSDMFQNSWFRTWRRRTARSTLARPRTARARRPPGTSCCEPSSRRKSPLLLLTETWKREIGVRWADDAKPGLILIFDGRCLAQSPPGTCRSRSSGRKTGKHLILRPTSR